MSMLTRWDPFGQLNPFGPWFNEMGRFQREMDRLFDRWGFGSRAQQPLAVSYPAVNVWEDEDAVYAEAEVPGLSLEDLEIYVTGENQLTLQGRRQPIHVEKAGWHRQERGFGNFARVLTLPVAVDPDRVEARLEHGVLTIKMAKSEAAKPKRISVKGD